MGTRRTVTRTIGLVCAASAMLALAPAANAATLWVDPMGDNSDTSCPEADPCDLKTAVDSSVDDDVVLVKPGTHQFPGGVDESDATTIRGLPGPGGPRPTIVVHENGVRLFDPAAVVEDLRFTDDADGANSLISAHAGNILQRLELIADGDTAVAVYLFDDAILRDSFVHFEGTNWAVEFRSPGGHVLSSTVVTDTGQVPIQAAGFGSPQASSVRNVIAVSSGPGIQSFGSGVEVDVDHSSFNGVDATSGSTIDLGLGNQDQSMSAAPPLLSDGFHQLGSSPTRDAGMSDGFTGPLDIDGDPRVVGAAIDIGADEFVPPPPPPPSTPLITAPQPDCSPLRKKFRKAKKQRGKAKRALKRANPIAKGKAQKKFKQKKRKVLKLKRKLRVRGC